GMSQRGGDVQSHLRISDKPIYSDLITQGGADIILSVEPMEALRYLPFLSPSGYLITNIKAYKNIDNYPDEEDIMKSINQINNKIAINADNIAKEEIKSTRSSNIVMLGAAAPFLGFELHELETAIKQLFGRKGENIVDMNIRALHAGNKFAMENR
ncbi:MAG: indolepyruvate oxidoreductase subunit beta, partial [Bacteroidales bacterium]